MKLRLLLLSDVTKSCMTRNILILTTRRIQFCVRSSLQHSGYKTRKSDFVLKVGFINRHSSWDRIKPSRDFAPQTAEDDFVTNLTQRSTALRMTRYIVT